MTKRVKAITSIADVRDHIQARRNAMEELEQWNLALCERCGTLQEVHQGKCQTCGNIHLSLCYSAEVFRNFAEPIKQQQNNG